jgi:hypothetical protein
MRSKKVGQLCIWEAIGSMNSQMISSEKTTCYLMMCYLCENIKRNFYEKSL